MKVDNRFFRFWRNLTRSGADAARLPCREGGAHTPGGGISTDTSPGKNGIPGKSSRKILLVDDDLIIQRTVQQAVEKRGYQVLIAGDISVALGLVRQEKPDLILLDLEFPFNPGDVGGPSQDGFFVIEWLRRANGPKPIPIIVISGTNPEKYKAQIAAAGIVACFQKPLDHGELLAAIAGAVGVGRWT